MWREEVDLRARALKRACEATVSICLDHRGVHVTVATHRSRVTEESRSAIDGFIDSAPERALALRRADLGQLARHGRTGTPGAEVLRRERATCDITRKVVDVRGSDGMDAPVFVGPLEQDLTGKLLTAPNEGGKLSIGDDRPLPQPALAAIGERNSLIGDRRMLVPQGRQPVRPVFVGITLVADSHERTIEQRDRAREYSGA